MNKLKMIMKMTLSDNVTLSQFEKVGDVNMAYVTVNQTYILI